MGGYGSGRRRRLERRRQVEACLILDADTIPRPSPRDPPRPGALTRPPHPCAPIARSWGGTYSPARTAVLWLRRDLRLHDHPALVAALDAADVVVPLYVLDELLLAGPRAATNRTWFFLESLRALADDLAGRGSPLVVRSGRPEEIVPAVAAARERALAAYAAPKG